MTSRFEKVLSMIMRPYKNIKEFKRCMPSRNRLSRIGEKVVTLSMGKLDGSG